MYGHLFAESLKHELSSSVADALLLNAPFTPRHKRNLLLQASLAIERREEFILELDFERKVLESVAKDLQNIHSTIDRLRECSLQEQPLEELTVIWKGYEDLSRRCEGLLQEQQERIHDAAQSIQKFGERHAFNGHLYAELDTSYPVLVALAVT